MRLQNIFEYCFYCFTAHGGADLRLSWSSARHQLTLPDHRYGASASRGVPIYVPALLVLIALILGGMARLS